MFRDMESKGTCLQWFVLEQREKRRLDDISERAKKAVAAPTSATIKWTPSTALKIGAERATR